MKMTDPIHEAPRATDIAAEKPAAVRIRRRREDRPATAGEMASFDAAVAKWTGTGRKRMLELGFETTEDFMRAIRGRKL